MIRTAIQNAIIAWLVAAGVAGGIASPAGKVILADQDAVRPPLPYVTVKVIVYDVPVHTDEDLVDDSDPPTWRARGLRTGTVSVNAYGAEAEGWLERAVLMLRSPSVLEQLSTAGLTVRPTGGINNLSALLDDKTQVRFQRDFAVDYQRVLSAEEAVEVVPLEQVVYDLETRDDELDAGTAAGRTETVTIEVS